MSQQLAVLTERNLFDFLQPKKQDIISLMGGEMQYKREVSFAIQAANSNPQLMQATPVSVSRAIYNLSITGLSLNPILKLAYLTPRRNGDVTEAQLTPSYQGLVKLLKDCGCVRNVYAHPRYEGDEWVYRLGTEVVIEHTPNHKTKNILGVYAVAILPDGEKVVEYMTTEEVHGIRSRSDGYRAFASGKIKSNPWVTDEAEMFRKTAIRRIFKYVPKSGKYDQVAKAIELDEQDFPATLGQVGYIESLISTSTFDEDMRDMFRGKIDDLTSGEAESIISELRNNQLNPITQGANYSQTDIKNELK